MGNFVELFFLLSGYYQIVKLPSRDNRVEFGHAVTIYVSRKKVSGKKKS
jgi:hypothetical protein